MQSEVQADVEVHEVRPEAEPLLEGESSEEVDQEAEAIEESFDFSMVSDYELMVELQGRLGEVTLRDKLRDLLGKVIAQG